MTTLNSRGGAHHLSCAPKRSTVQLPAGGYSLSEFVATEGAEAKTDKHIADMSLTLTVSEQTVTLRQNDDTIVSSQLEKLSTADSYEGCPRWVPWTSQQRIV